MRPVLICGVPVSAAVMILLGRAAGGPTAGSGPLTGPDRGYAPRLPTTAARTCRAQSSTLRPLVSTVTSASVGTS